MNELRKACGSVWRCVSGVPVLLLFALVGCATVSPPPVTTGSLNCSEFWQAMDTAVSREGVGDGYGVRVEGYEYLRADRFLESLGSQADTRRKEHVFIERLRQLDLKHRYMEIEFLSDEAWADLGRQGLPLDEGLFKRRMAKCSATFMAEDQQDTDYVSKVRAGIHTDQDYSTLFRSLGLYSLTRYVVDWRVASYQEAHPLSTLVDKAEHHIIEPPLGQKLSAKRVMRLLRNGRKSPFLDFQFREQDLLNLVHYYAPVFALGGTSFGRIVPDGQGDWQVDEAQPVVYYYLSQALVQSIPAVQINYVVWFNQRKDPAPWYTQGHLDGMTLRLTLDWQGTVLAVDSIGNCGCFYVGLSNGAISRERQDMGEGFRPHFAGVLAEHADTDHVAVEVAAGSNGLRAMGFTALTQETDPYVLLPYESLERYSPDLPYKFFDDQGFVENTERFERFFLYPMGIPGIGAMRQRSRHPITLTDRAYFDDPRLFDSVLELKEPLPKRKKLVKKGKKRPSNLKRRVESGKAMGGYSNRRKEKYFRSRDMEM